MTLMSFTRYWLPAIVVAIGILLAALSFRGSAKWLIVPALALSIGVGVAAAADLDLEGGVGKKRFTPQTVDQIRPEYRVGVGEMVIDLRDLELPVVRGLS